MKGQYYMKKRKKIVSTLMVASTLANQPINVLAEELNDTNITNIAQIEANSDTEIKSNGLNEVYLDGSKLIRFRKNKRGCC